MAENFNRMRSFDLILDRTWAGGILVPGAPVALAPDVLAVDAQGTLLVAEGLAGLPPRHPVPKASPLRVAVLDSGLSLLTLQEAGRALRSAGWWVTDAGGAALGRVIYECLATPGMLIVGNHPGLGIAGAAGCLVLPARPADALLLDRGLPMTLPTPEAWPIWLAADSPEPPDGTALGLSLWAQGDSPAWRGRVVLLEGPGAAALPLDDRLRCTAVLLRAGALAAIFPGDGIVRTELELLGRSPISLEWSEGSDHLQSFAWSQCHDWILPPGPDSSPQPAEVLEDLSRAGILLGGPVSGTSEMLARWGRGMPLHLPWQESPLLLDPASPLELRRMAATGMLDGWLGSGGRLTTSDTPLPAVHPETPWLGTEAWSSRHSWLVSPGCLARWMHKRWPTLPPASGLPVTTLDASVVARSDTLPAAAPLPEGEHPVAWSTGATLAELQTSCWLPVEEALTRLHAALGLPPGPACALVLQGTGSLGSVPEPWIRALVQLGVRVVVAEAWDDVLPLALAEAGIRPWTRGGTAELRLRRPEGGMPERLGVRDPLDDLHRAILESGGLSGWLRLHLEGHSSWTLPGTHGES